MLFIYIILLVNNTYLIISSEDRISEIHNTPNYKDMIEMIKTNDKSDFDKIVKKYVDEFGNDKVKTSIINNITEDDKNIMEYFDNITDVNAIENEIKKLRMLNQKLIQLEIIVQQTSLNQIKEYGVGKFISDYAKYQKFMKPETKDIIRRMSYRHISSRRNPQNNDNINNNNLNNDNINNEILELVNYFTTNQEPNQIFENMQSMLSILQSNYNNYIQYEINKKLLPSNFLGDGDVIIQIYSTMYFNKKMKSHLENFIKKNGSKEQLITKIIYAYSKLLEL